MLLADKGADKHFFCFIGDPSCYALQLIPVWWRRCLSGGEDPCLVEEIPAWWRRCLSGGIFWEMASFMGCAAYWVTVNLPWDLWCWLYRECKGDLEGIWELDLECGQVSRLVLFCFVISLLSSLFPPKKVL